MGLGRTRKRQKHDCPALSAEEWGIVSRMAGLKGK